MAASSAARRGSAVIEQRDFEEAIDRIQLGLKKRGRAMNGEEKRRVAFHEAGRTLVALSVEAARPLEAHIDCTPASSHVGRTPDYPIARLPDDLMA